MNTVRSVYYGWGALIVAGGGAYYFAKKAINADRAAKSEAIAQKRIAQYQLETAHLNPSAQQPMQSSVATTPASKNSVMSEVARARASGGGGDKDWSEGANNPSQEASMDPAPTRHAPEDQGEKMREKSKYEATDVFRSRKGDRFS